MAGFQKKSDHEAANGPPSKHSNHDGQIFAGLFVAAPEEVAAWDMTGLTPPEWPAVEFKRLDTVKLGTLEAILTHRPYDDLDRSDLHKLIRNGGADGPWIIAVPPDLTTALAELPPDRAAVVAEQWADTDEFKIRPTDPVRPKDIQDLTQLLGDMAALARHSRESGTPTYLLMSL
jgi:hypothetical protein